MARFSVDVYDVILGLLRAGLDPSVAVRNRIPDNIPDLVPLVVARRGGGSSNHPQFYDRPQFTVQTWVAPTPEQDDPWRAASDLIDDARRVLYTAWEQQNVVPEAGHLASYLEDVGPLDVGDPGLPHYGRYVLTIRATVRPPRA